MTDHEHNHTSTRDLKGTLAFYLMGLLVILLLTVIYAIAQAA